MKGIEELPKPEVRGPKPDPLAPEPLHDLGIRLFMIPTFGVVIPYFSGYFGPYTPSSARYWAGLLWANLISFAIWHGNRFFLLKQRQHYDWFRHPIRKICLLLFANFFYTAPVAVVMMLAWYRFAGFGPDWNAIRIVALSSVICVVFITHLYETVYLIQQRENDLLAFERLERARTEAELEALKAQVAPHFLFNSLNTLSWLIENYPRKALVFNQDLAEVYRYILVAHRRELVPLEEEFAFAMRYFGLLQLRFEASLDLRLTEPGDRGHLWFLPPISLQVLFENAVKHNEHSRQHPLRLWLDFDRDRVVVSNEKRPMLTERPSSQVGLKGLDNRCRLVLGKGIEIQDSAERFTVRVPVRSVPA
jgi:hypothetical protein